MTLDERKKYHAEKLFGRPLDLLSPNQMTQVEDAALQDLYADYDSQEADIDARYSMGADLFGAPLPEGKRVGASGIYVAPNWAESLEGGFNRVMGGYMMGRARKDLEAMGDKRAGARQDAARLAAQEEERRRQWLSGLLRR